MSITRSSVNYSRVTEFRGKNERKERGTWGRVDAHEEDRTHQAERRCGFSSEEGGEMTRHMENTQTSPTHQPRVCRRGGSPPKTLSWSAAVRTKQTDDVWNGGGHSLQYFHATQVQCHCIWTVVYTTTSTITMTIIIVFLCTQQSKCSILFGMKCTSHLLQEDMEWRDVMWPRPRWHLRVFPCSRPWKSYYHRQSTF